MHRGTIETQVGQATQGPCTMPRQPRRTKGKGPSGLICATRPEARAVGTGITPCSGQRGPSYRRGWSGYDRLASCCSRPRLWISGNRARHFKRCDAGLDSRIPSITATLLFCESSKFSKCQRPAVFPSFLSVSSVPRTHSCTSDVANRMHQTDQRDRNGAPSAAICCNLPP